MSDSVIRQFATDIERHRELLEVLIKKNNGNVTVLAILCGCMLINAVERRLLERELKQLKSEVKKLEAIDV